MLLDKKYETTILLSRDFREKNLKKWLLNYYKYFKKYNITNISFIYKNKIYFNHSSKEKLKGNYIQLNFSTKPKYIKKLNKFLRLDAQVLKFLIFKI